MSTARDVIKEALVLNATRATTTKTDAILAALSAAGYRIVGPGEVDRETLEKAAEVADEAKQMRERLYAETPAGINAHKAVQAEEIAAATRALGGKDA